MTTDEREYGPGASGEAARPLRVPQRSRSRLRFLWWTFNVLAAISAALLVMVIASWAHFASSDPTVLQILAGTPAIPLVAYSVLPATWLILKARRRRREPPRGFEVMSPVRQDENSGSPGST